MSKKNFYTILTITLFSSLLFFLFPKIDLYISHIFYMSNGYFLLGSGIQRHYADLFRNFLVYLTYGFIISLVILTLFGIFFNKYPKFFCPKNCAFILLCFLLAPVSFVNVGLKDHWGRARPFQTTEFGGNKQFTPAWVLSDQCKKNCSFTSGETANIFCYLALIFILPRNRKVLYAIIAAGFLISFERLAQGEHFFSDIILSALLDYIIIWLVYQICFSVPVKNQIGDLNERPY